MPNHYYFFPFAPNSGDKDQQTTRATMRLKYERGMPTRSAEARDVVHEKDNVRTIVRGFRARTNLQKKRTPQGSIDINCTYYREKNNEDVEVWAGDGGTPLSVVKQNDVLMIDGHGDGSSSSIANLDNPRDPKYIKMNVVLLAQLLKAQGLGNGVVIKLLTCKGGGRPGSAVDSDFNYARNLAIRLAGRGYELKNVVVGGYPGEVNIMFAKVAEKYFPVQLQVRNESNVLVKGKEVIRYYDGNGSLVDRPVESKNR